MEVRVKDISFGNVDPMFPTETSFTLNIPTSSGINSVSIIIPAGSSYTKEEFSSLIQYTCMRHNFVLFNASGRIYNFIEISYRKFTGKVVLLFKSVPTSLPPGYTNPFGMTFPKTTSCGQLVLTDTRLCSLLGFRAGSYPSTSHTRGNSIRVIGNKPTLLRDSLLVFMDDVWKPYRMYWDLMMKRNVRLDTLCFRSRRKRRTGEKRHFRRLGRGKNFKW